MLLRTPDPLCKCERIWARDYQLWVGLKRGMGNEKMREWEMGKWRNCSSSKAKAAMATKIPMNA